MGDTRKFTILHSNDMHGDFFAEMEEGKTELIGGLALLSGYIAKVRAEEEHVLYVIAGDMLQGSLIDTEFKGISTIELMNYLAPDVVTLGNHELDYGLPHLLFLEKMANFPLVNANLYVRKNQRRLMAPYVVLEKAGFDILFTGILTEKVMDSLSQDSLVGSFVDLESASDAVGRITNAYKTKDIDLTVLLTHIGFESDVELARMLDPEWGVDMIIGGHSHTILDAPAEENGVLIAQAGVGTDQIGRFDIVVDDDTNAIIEWNWQLITIEPGIAEPDARLNEFIESYKKVVDDKYGALLTKFSREFTHPLREEESTLGNALADVFADAASCDIMFLGAGSIRVESLGPIVTLGDLLACFPYDDKLIRYSVTGEVLKGIFAHIMRNENRDGEGECYQVNAGVEAIYDTAADELVSLSLAGEPISEPREYIICLQGYHASNSEANLGVSTEVLESGDVATVSTSAQQVLEERLADTQNRESVIEGRLVYR